VHYQKCFLLNAEHVGYEPVDEASFTSGICKPFLKTCDKILPDKSIHHAKYLAGKGWGPYLGGTPTRMTQAACINACEKNSDCEGWSYRDGEKTHVHYQKCFLLNAEHVGYEPVDEASFTSGTCSESQREDVDVEMTVDYTATEFKEHKDELTASIAASLGLSADDISIKIGTKKNPRDARRLSEGLVITVTFRVPAAKVADIVEELEKPAFATATGASFLALKPAHGSSICATCKWDGTKIHVTHYLNAQKAGEKGLQHKCYHAEGRCKCTCA